MFIICSFGSQELQFSGVFCCYIFPKSIYFLLSYWYNLFYFYLQFGSVMSAWYSNWRTFNSLTGNTSCTVPLHLTYLVLKFFMVELVPYQLGVIELHCKLELVPYQLGVIELHCKVKLVPYQLGVVELHCKVELVPNQLGVVELHCKVELVPYQLGVIVLHCKVELVPYQLGVIELHC